MKVLVAVGHTLRVLSVGLVISKLYGWKGSSQGLSWKTQILFFIVFVCDAILFMPRRMSDLIEEPFSPLCSATLLMGQLIVLTLFACRGNTYNAIRDNSRYESLIAFVLLVSWVQWIDSTSEVLLNFRVLLDCIAILPQVFMLSKIRGVHHGFFTRYFLLLMCYKLCLIVAMWLDYNYRGIEFSSQIVVLSFLQLFTYILFFIIPKRHGDLREQVEEILKDLILEEIEDGKLNTNVDKETSFCTCDKGHEYNIFGCPRHPHMAPYTEYFSIARYFDEIYDYIKALESDFNRPGTATTC